MLYMMIIHSKCMGRMRGAKKTLESSEAEHCMCIVVKLVVGARSDVHMVVEVLSKLVPIVVQ